MMAASQSRTNFYKFSAEIRNEIYRLIFSDHTWSEGDSHDRIVIQDIALEPGDMFENEWESSYGQNLRVPTLLQTTQQIRAETEAFYYGSTTFIAKIEGEHTFEVGTWLANLGPVRCAMIKNFIIDLHMVDECTLLDRIVNRPKNGRAVLHPNFLGEAANGRRMRTTISHIVEYYDLAQYGVAASAFKVHWNSGCFGDEAKDKVSPTALWCETCLESDEPESVRFGGGVCKDCFTV